MTSLASQGAPSGPSPAPGGKQRYLRYIVIRGGTSQPVKLTRSPAAGSIRWPLAGHTGWFAEVVAPSGQISYTFGVQATGLTPVGNGGSPAMLDGTLSQASYGGSPAEGLLLWASNFNLSTGDVVLTTSQNDNVAYEGVFASDVNVWPDSSSSARMPAGVPGATAPLRGALVVSPRGLLRRLFGK